MQCCRSNSSMTIIIEVPDNLWTADQLETFGIRLWKFLTGLLDEEQFLYKFISIVAASYRENGMALFINMTKQRGK